MDSGLIIGVHAEIVNGGDRSSDQGAHGPWGLL